MGSKLGVYEMAWAKNGTPDTLGSALDDMDITDLTATTFNQFLIHSLTVGGENVHIFTFDNNGNTDYARRRSNNGGADSTTINQDRIEYYGGEANDRFEIIYGVNISGEEKLQIHNLVNFGSASGAGNAPSRAKAVSKVDTTTNSGQYTRIDCNSNTSGNYDTSSNISALGTD